MSTHRSCIAALTWCLMIGTGFRAQNPFVLLNVDGTVPAEALGSQFALAGMGDVDGDGVPDFAAGSPNWPMPNPANPGTTIAQVGRAGVFSGATGTALFFVYGTFNLQALGKAVANVGDIDGDGRNEVAVGAPMFGPTVPGQTPPPQQVQVWSGGAHTLLYTINGGSGGFSSTNFGTAIAGIGDVGSVVAGAYSPVPDFVPDILVGAPTGNAAFVHSGLTGALLYALNAATVNPPAPAPPWLGTSDQFGFSVAAVGDVNGDGYSEFLVGAPSSALGGTLPVPPNTWYSGAAFLFSGTGGVLLHVFTGGPGDTLGYSVAGIGDVNLDGYPDMAIGAIRTDVGGTDTGSVTAYSGANYAPLWTTSGLAASDSFGYAVAAAGDVNRDGTPDVVVGAPTTDVGATNTGSVTVLSGVNGSRLGVVHGVNASDLRGRSVTGMGDVDGDGFDDVAAGTPGSDVGGSGTGSVAILAFGPYLRPAAAGNLPAPGGGTFDMLLVDGSAGGLPRRIDLALTQPFTFSVQQPPTFAVPALTYVFCFIGVPTAADEADPGAGIGTLCFLPPLLNPVDPRLFLLANNLLPFDPTAVLPAVPPGPWSLPVPSGFLAPVRLAIQCVTFDGAALYRSNAILLNVR